MSRFLVFVLTTLVVPTAAFSAIEYEYDDATHVIVGDWAKIDFTPGGGVAVVVTRKGDVRLYDLTGVQDEALIFSSDYKAENQIKCSALEKILLATNMYKGVPLVVWGSDHPEQKLAFVQVFNEFSTKGPFAGTRRNIRTNQHHAVPVRALVPLSHGCTLVSGIPTLRVDEEGNPVRTPSGLKSYKHRKPQVFSGVGYPDPEKYSVVISQFLDGYGINGSSPPARIVSRDNGTYRVLLRVVQVQGQIGDRNGTLGMLEWYNFTVQEDTRFSEPVDILRTEDVRTRNGPAYTATGFDVSADGTRIAVSTKKDGVIIVDPGRQQKVPLAHKGRPDEVELSPDGSLLITACRYFLHATREDGRQYKLDESVGTVWKPQFSPSGSWFVVQGNGRVVVRSASDPDDVDQDIETERRKLWVRWVRGTEKPTLLVADGPVVKRIKLDVPQEVAALKQ